VKVIVTNFCWGNLLQKAQKIFEKHNLHLTEKRNGVMILLIVKNRELLIYGDKGINEAVGENFWVDTKDKMIEMFKGNLVAEGVVAGIEDIGAKLVEFFPVEKDDVNELCNKVIYE
jgi:uncharacterized membrane protein